MTHYVVHVDMDGVIADFDGRVNAVEEIKQARESVAMLARNLGEPYSTCHFKDLGPIYLRGPQTNPHLHRLKKKLDNAKSLIFNYASRDGFFIGLDKMPDADELMDGIIALTKKKPNILTAPLETSRNCKWEKKAWIEKHYKDKINNFYIEGDKHKYAAPNHILIDDTPKKIRPFVEKGGIGILHTSAKDSLEQLERILRTGK